MGISLISLGNWTKCWIFFLKVAFAHFLLIFVDFALNKLKRIFSL